MGAIGIDIGGSNLRAARVDADGRIEQHISEEIRLNPDDVVRRVAELWRALDQPDVVAVGIGVPGRVDARRREVLSGGYVDLAGTQMAERLEGVFGRPVVIDNDCNMALVAEMAIGAARGCRDVVMFTIGTGIGGAIALDGAVVRGTATAGQLGHLTVEADGPLCNCGRRGCVETTSSGRALGRHIAEAGLPQAVRAEDLMRRADAGDAAAAQVLMRWVGPLRCAIDSMVAAVAPERVLLGGGLGHAASVALARAPAVSPWYQCPVAAARLGDDAGVIGAGLAAVRAAAEARP